MFAKTMMAAIINVVKSGNFPAEELQRLKDDWRS